MAQVEKNFITNVEEVDECPASVLGKSNILLIPSQVSSPSKVGATSFAEVSSFSQSGIARSFRPPKLSVLLSSTDSGNTRKLYLKNKPYLVHTKKYSLVKLGFTVFLRVKKAQRASLQMSLHGRGQAETRFACPQVFPTYQFHDAPPVVTGALLNCSFIRGL